MPNREALGGKVLALGGVAAATLQLLLSPGCASPERQVARDTKPVRDAIMNQAAPLTIVLRRSGNELKATIVNRSAVTASVLCDGELQPSRLKLVASDGTRMSAMDGREIEKFDTTPYCGLFRPLAAGRELEIGWVRFNRNGDRFSGTWGPFLFDSLPPGDYQASVEWRSELEQCFDEGSQQMRKVPNLWTGVVRSNELALSLR